MAPLHAGLAGALFLLAATGSLADNAGWDATTTRYLEFFWVASLCDREMAPQLARYRAHARERDVGARILESSRQVVDATIGDFVSAAQKGVLSGKPVARVLDEFCRDNAIEGVSDESRSTVTGDDRRWARMVVDITAYGRLVTVLSECGELGGEGEPYDGLAVPEEVASYEHSEPEDAAIRYVALASGFTAVPRAREAHGERMCAEAHEAFNRFEWSR